MVFYLAPCSKGKTVGKDEQNQVCFNASQPCKTTQNATAPKVFPPKSSHTQVPKDARHLNTLRYTRITGFAQLSRIFNFYLAGLLHRP